MVREVSTPSPPRILSRASAEEDTDSGNREAIAAQLEAGAWEAAFGQWLQETDLDDAEFAIVDNLGLFDRFDFFWDEDLERVTYEAPQIPRNWKQQPYRSEIDAREQVAAINDALDELGRIVRDTLVSDYLGEDEWADPSG